MSELIDRQVALRLCIEGDGYDDEGFTEGYNFAVSEIREKLQTLPTNNPEVRHGRWIIRGGDMWCSECGYEDVTEFGEPEDYHYCPNCGCCMKEDINNG